MMNPLLIIILSVVISAPENPQYRDFREVLLFAPAEETSLLKTQLSIFEKDPNGLKERDLKISITLWNSKQAAFYSKWKVNEKDFTLILIGKDGQEKFRSAKTVTLKQLYGIIDVMPMRRSEMRKQ